MIDGDGKTFLVQGVGRSLERYNWSRLTPLQVGRYAEYLVKMEFTLWGFDVYTSEVDDKGIDFVIRRDQGRYYEIQVKSLRGLGYIFLTKDKFPLRENLLAAIVLFANNEAPSIYLIPSSVWLEPNALFVSRDYNKEGQKSKPEWGLNISQRNLPLLTSYVFDRMIQAM